MVKEAAESSPLPLPPPKRPNAEAEEAASSQNFITTRRGVGTCGRRISLRANHFKVSVNKQNAVFYQYAVFITSDDHKPVQSKGIGRKVLDSLHRTYGSSDLAGRSMAYDGEKSVYTVGPLPGNRLIFTVVVEESFAKNENGSESSGMSDDPAGKRLKRSFRSRIFKVELKYADEIPMESIALALKGIEADARTQDALRVLNTILRQNAANRGCLLVRQSFFQDNSRYFTDIGGGATAVQGFHSSFLTTQGGLSLNMDVSTTLILTPGPVIEFLKANQNVKDPRYIDWAKAKRMLKNLRVKTRHSNMEYKIIGLSEKPCNQQYFVVKARNRDRANDEPQTIQMSVSDYFYKHHGIQLNYSGYFPCLDVGKPKRPNYQPLELCSLLSLQRYTKPLSSLQRATLVEKSRLKPNNKIQAVTNAVGTCRYNEDPLLLACGISIEAQLTRIDGRILETPKLKVGNSEDCTPRDGRWNFNNKKLLKPVHIDRWAVVNFSARFNMSRISRELIDCGIKRGMVINRPQTIIEEDPQCRRGTSAARVEKMFDLVVDKLGDKAKPQLLLCVLPEKRNSDIYGPWKKKCLSDYGIATQCISPTKINDQCLTNVLLKINSKLGGINSLLATEHSSGIPLITDTPTMILGMDVSHGPPGSDIPSIAAVVGSQYWPLISRYGASVRTQSPKEEMINSLFKLASNGHDVGIMSELLRDFRETNNRRQNPKQIIMFRDGVSEKQFDQVLNIEVQQIKKAYQKLGKADIPKFTVIVGQKNHHTRLFQDDGPHRVRPDNVPPGTVVDTKIVHPRNYDFYMCAQAGTIEIKLMLFGYHLFHAVAPIYYAHLAAKQVGQFIKFDDLSETSSGRGSMTSMGTAPVPELPRLHKDVAGSMFFC